MQLHNARLCLDCNEVHEMQHCPSCGSEALAFVTQWVPADERRRRARPATSPEAEVYRELLNTSSESRRGTLLKRGAFGVGLLAAAGLIWRELATAAESSRTRSRVAVKGQADGKGEQDSPTRPAGGADPEP